MAKAPEHKAALMKRLYTCKEAAVYLGKTECAVGNMVRDGKLPCIKDGRRTYLDINDLEAWISGHRFDYGIWN